MLDKYLYYPFIRKTKRGDFLWRRWVFGGYYNFTVEEAKPIIRFFNMMLLIAVGLLIFLIISGLNNDGDAWVIIDSRTMDLFSVVWIGLVIILAVASIFSYIFLFRLSLKREQQ